MQGKAIIKLLFLSTVFLACSDQKINISIAHPNESNNCLLLKEIVEQNNIATVEIRRPFGFSKDTSTYNLKELSDLYGERLFTLGLEQFVCRDIDSIVYIQDNTLILNYNQSGRNTNGPFTQEYVSSYWEAENGYLLKKKLPKFNGTTYKGNESSLDSIISNSEKTLLHFGFLACQGCMKEQNRMDELIKQNSEVSFVNISIDKKEKLDKYLIDRGDYFETKHPYNNISERIRKPLMYEDQDILLDLFSLNSAFPVNFLVDQSGTVVKIGLLDKIFEDENQEIEIFTF